MFILAKKLWRTIKTTSGQFLAVTAVVMVGITVYISMGTVSYNMIHSKDLFYRENNFADYYFHVIKAPEGMIKRIESVPGVARATGRIQKDVPVIGEGGERATARLTSYPLPMNTEVNRLHLLTGRLFEKYPEGSDAEVLLDPQYAAANKLSPGDTVTVVAESRQVSLTVVGTATAPEFIYPMKDPASLIPEPGNFGIFMVPHNQVQQILNLSGQINQVVISFAERKRELAALRVMGFTVQEVSGLLLKENLLQTLLGVALGLPFGRFLAEYYIQAMMTASDLYSTYTFKIVIYPLTYVLSALGGIIFIMAAYRIAVRGIKTLDLVEVLKTRD